MEEDNRAYIHGTQPSEQERLQLLNRLTNPGFIDFLKVKEKVKILDVGSGLGILAAEIAKRYPSCEITGIEYSEDQLAKADNTISNLTFVSGDAHELPFEDESFDMVYCRYLLEHVQHPDKVLKEMHRVLKSGGQCFVQENNIDITVYYPEVPKFMHIWRQFIRLQTSLGGDALIGKKLYFLLKEAGFSKVELSICPQVHGFEDVQFDDWIENIIGNVKSGKDSLIENKLATEQELKQAIQEIRVFQKNTLSSTVFYWNRAIGRK